MPRTLFSRVSKVGYHRTSCPNSSGTNDIHIFLPIEEVLTLSRNLNTVLRSLLLQSGRTNGCLYHNVNHLSLDIYFSAQLSILTMSSNLLSTLPPTSPALAQNFDMCLVPESHKIVTTLCPGPSRRATRTAAEPSLPVRKRVHI